MGSFHILILRFKKVGYRPSVSMAGSNAIEEAVEYQISKLISLSWVPGPEKRFVYDSKQLLQGSSS